MLILEIFFKSSIGWWWRLVDFCWWWWVLPVGGSCAWVWWWRVVLCISVWWGFVEGFEFFFSSLLLRFLDLEFVGRLVIVVVVCGSGCSGGS